METNNPNPSPKIAVIGSGSWATALIKMITDGGKSIQWWIRNEEKANYIKEFKHNPDYLSSVEIHPDWVTVETQLQRVVDSAEIIILAIPSAYLHQALSTVQLPSNKLYVSAIKGIEPNTQNVIARYLQEFHHIPENQIGIITGPCHAEEVAAEKLSFLTAAASENEVAQQIANLVKGRYINVCCNNDLIGAEYAAVMKNIYAIGAGIVHGLGYGDNYLALYTSAAIREMDFFLNQISPDHRDVKEAAYLGDLLVTCYSPFSRNRTFGNMLGKGYSASAAQLEMNMVAEGYFASKLIELQCIEHKIQLPIAHTVYQVIYENGNARKLFNQLNNQLN